MPPSIFEEIFDGSILEQSVSATLRKWLPTYLAEIQNQRGEAAIIPPLKSYVRRNEFTTYPDEMIPFAVVIAPGLAEPAVSDGEGRYSGWWTLGVGIVAGANTEENTNELTKKYGAAVRAILLQKQGLDEAWEYGGIEWFDEAYDDLPDIERERSMRSVALIFRVWVMNITTKWAGPAHPDDPDPDQPGAEWPTVIEADVVVNVVEEVQP